MRLIIKLTFAALLLLNSMPQIVGRRAFRIVRKGRNFNDLIVSERRAEDKENDEDKKLFTDFLLGLKDDIRQDVYTIIQLTALIETYSCIQDKAKRKKVGGMYYNEYSRMYPAIQHRYKQFSE
jgi:hypothetical protein